MFKRDYERAAKHVNNLYASGAKPVVVDEVIRAYLALFNPVKAFDARKWGEAIKPALSIYPFRVDSLTKRLFVDL